MSDNEVVISVENLWKQYRYGVISHKTLSEDVKSWWARKRGKEDPNLPISKAQYAMRKAQNAVPSAHSHTSDSVERFWALQDISFEVKKGEVLGIIGRNGAGKSTLLKIMSRVTTPTRGSINIKGRVASLLEVGTGFHPELTGRENVFLNGAILGMTRVEIRKKFDEIVSFSEIEKFIDTPVKRYSSGMRVRLAFAVAAHLEPEILIVDEVLAVGDAAFQKRCLGKMEDVSREGRTVLFVSHNMNAIQRLCPETILLENGQLRKQGKSPAVIQYYIGAMTDRSGVYQWNWKDYEKVPLGPFVPLYLRILSHEGEVTERVVSNKSFYIEIGYEVAQPTRNLQVGLTMSTGMGEQFCVAWDDNPIERTPGIYTRRCEIPANLFSHGGFIVGIISSVPGVMKTYRNPELLKFYIDSSSELSNLGRHILKPSFKWETKDSREEEKGKTYVE